MTVRVGHIAFLNCFPLFFGLEQMGVLEPDSDPGRAAGRRSGHVAEADMELLLGVPTELNKLLVAGQLDVSPISSIAYAAHHRDLLISRHLSISSVGPVDSIQLVTRGTPLQAVRRVAVTQQSATSVVLLKVIFGLRYGQQVECEGLSGTVRDALADHDAVLLIGDQGLEALHFPSEGTTSYDLGEIWYRWTGLPMVYAVWAAREEFAQLSGVELLLVEQALVRALEYGQAHMPDVVRSAAVSYRFSESQIARFFSRLHYGFSADYQRGLELFYELAHEAGELHEMPRLRFIDEYAVAVPR